MAEASEAMKAMARRIASETCDDPAWRPEIIAGKHDDWHGVRLALAAIIETTELAANHAENMGACSNTSGRAGCCEALGEDIAVDLRDGDHIRTGNHYAKDENNG